MVSPFLFFPDERLSLAELTAACLDGWLVPIGEGFMPADAAETAWMRARSLAPLLDGRWAAVRRSAAWVHGGIAEEPSRHHLQRVTDRRIRSRVDARAVFHDVKLPPVDVHRIGGAAVSTPARTLVDLARSDEPLDSDAAREWAERDPLVASDARDWLHRHPRFPHSRRAVQTLDDRGDYDEVTR